MSRDVAAVQMQHKSFMLEASGADAFYRALPSWAYDGVDAIMMTVFAALRSAIVTASVFGTAIAVTRSRSQSAPAPGA